MTQDKILQLIQSKLNIEYIDINDLTSKHITHKHYDQGGHYTLIVVSDDFKNISLLERHKIIYNILNGILNYIFFGFFNSIFFWNIVFFKD